MRITDSSIEDIVVCKPSSSASISYKGQLWSPIAFSVSFEGLKSVPDWTLCVEVNGHKEPLPQDSFKLIEGVQ